MAKNQETRTALNAVGVYVCHCGGNISDDVDVAKVASRPKMPGVVVARTNMFMCSDPGQELIIEELKAAGWTGSWWLPARPACTRPRSATRSPGPG